ncbi:Glucosamine-6-phosphate isomerase [Operophtera brumata]|uniref:Glucosamine-6-phosphate deaminase n=1 Tax=Operophtera brumata TaxID=104452 RepID=A0A0L7LAE5_OPEBR|nr:Glucosamine-6-phosphate isomerase [Operophtera brumata]
MRLIILEDADIVADWAARFVLQRVTQFKPGPGRHFVLGLPTGGTPLGMYRKLIQFYKEGRISFKYVTTFNMDEYVGLARDHPESYHYYMWNEFFKHVDIEPGNAHVLDGNAPDLVAECQRFEDLIKQAGGVQLFVGGELPSETWTGYIASGGASCTHKYIAIRQQRTYKRVTCNVFAGIGPDGHIAFNEPGSSLASRTRVKTLAYDTLEANKRFFGNDISKVPRQALTVGVATVMDAKEVMILITGVHKALALSKAVEEGVNHMWTVSAFQQHAQTLFVCDEAATLELRVKTVKGKLYLQSLMEEHNKLIEDKR